ncbi:hypothetical protein ACEN2P_08200 [Pedobacter psychrotolerans]|uniref:hypothetical protein n=1 Tax=Pedobacter psychrotolerans TaxID=1843235 RepID=UPI003F992F03
MALKYQDLALKQISLKEIGAEIFKQSGNHFLLGASMQEVASNALESLGFSRKVNLDEIASDCKTVLDGRYAVGNRTDEQIVDIFNKVVLDVHQLPKPEYDRLMKSSAEHLQIVSDLILEYEALPFTNDVLKGLRANGRNQAEYTEEIFYQRAKDKMDLIQDYIDNKVLDVAIYNSGEFYQHWKERHQGAAFIDKLHDFPYLDAMFRQGKLDIELDMEAIDFRKINPYKNKMLVFQFQHDIRTASHRELDQEITDRINIKRAMNKLCSEVRKIPVLNERKDIFDELNNLARGNYWYGFYALALPQVEGIVVELLNLVGITKGATKALPQKIEALRGISANGDFDMDYYQFLLPEKRNKFAHTGKDNEMKIKSLHLILDLTHLLSVAVNLENDLMKLNNIANDGYMGINHIGDLANMVRLVKVNTRHSEFDQVKSKLDKFVYRSLIKDFDFSALIKELSVLTHEQLIDFDTQISTHFFLKGNSLADFSQLSLADVGTNRLVIKQAAEESLSAEAYHLLMDIYIFTEQFDKCFPELPEPIKDSLNAFREEHQAAWAKLRILDSQYTSKTSGDYIIIRKDMVTLMDRVDLKRKRFWERLKRFFKGLFVKMRKKLNR